MLYNIADLIVDMDTFGTTLQRAEKYIYNGLKAPDFKLISNWKDKKAEFPNLCDDAGEYMSIGAVFYNHLLRRSGFMLHSSAVVVNNKAYLFTANSGVGKSTHTALWQQLLGERAFILNDDKPAIRFFDGKWYAYGTPWSGKHDISQNQRVEIGGIAVVTRGKENKIERFGGALAVSEIFRQINRPKNPEARVIILELLDKLFTEVPIWRLECNTDISAAKVSYEAMSGEISL